MDPRLLELLVCPVTKGPLDLDRQRQELISRSARLAYPIRDGIPVMLIEEGARWKDTPVEALPVPPPAATPAPATRSDEAAIATPAAGPDPRLLIAAAVALMVLVLVLVGLTRRQAAPDSEQPPVA